MSTDDTAAVTVWQTATSELREQLGESVWNAWFASVEPIGIEGDQLTLSVPADLFKRNIEDRYAATISSALAKASGKSVEFAFVVNTPKRITGPTPTGEQMRLDDVDGRVGGGPVAPPLDPPIDPSFGSPAGVEHRPLATTTTTAPRTTSFAGQGPQIIDSNTFDNFIIGESNRFAHAAALAVAESPASGYNPLFIYGGTGLGKTHLLHAIVNYIRRYTNLRATYTSSEQFTNEFIEMIRSDRRTDFRDRYRSTDVLLIDDIQFLAGKVETQNEFFHTFNNLHQSNRQIVIASDRPPKEISALEERLQSRFGWGLLIDIQPPDLETRIAILRNKVARSHLDVPADVIEFIAHRISDNIRALEGALNRIAAYAKIEGTPPSLARAEEILAGIGDAGTRQVTSDLILRETAEYYDTTVEDLLGPSRRRPLVISRQVAMYLHRELTELSLPRIGEIFGGRDHTTVLHAQRKITKEMNEKRQLLQQVNELASRIKLG